MQSSNLVFISVVTLSLARVMHRILYRIHIDETQLQK